MKHEPLLLIAEVAAKIRAYTYRFTSEGELQTQIARVLDGYDYEREFRLSEKDRIDFLVTWTFPTPLPSMRASSVRVGVEIKVGGGISEVTRQLHRYAEYDEIDGLILVTSKLRLNNLPATLREKPLRVVPLLESIL